MTTMSRGRRLSKIKRFYLNRFKGRMIPALLVAILFGAIGSTIIYFSYAARWDDDPGPTPTHISPNPTIVSQSCIGGLNIALLADTSNSVAKKPQEFGEMKTALKDFISSLLPGTRTYFSLTQFADEARVVRYFTNDIGDISNAIDGLTGSDGTNWAAGIQAAYGTFSGAPQQAPGLLIIATDGNPTVPRGSALIDAANVANTVKDAGIHMLALGIGEPTVKNLQYISGPKVNQGGVNSDVITTDFGNLNNALQDVARTTCSAGTGGSGTGTGGNGNGTGGTGNGTGTGGTGTGTNGTGTGTNGKGTGATGTGTGTSTGVRPQPSPTPVATAPQGTTPSPAPTQTPSPEPSPAPVATQTTEPTPTPAPTPTAQGVKTKAPEPQASPFFDGKQYSPGTSPDNFQPASVTRTSYVWIYITIPAVLLAGAGSFVYWRKRTAVPSKATRKRRKK